MLKFLERHAGSIQGTLGCFDRVLIQGHLRYIGNSYEITKYFRCRKIMFKEFQEWAKPYTERIRADVKAVADTAGVEIQVIRKSRSVRKEDLVEAILKTRGRHPGVVHILSTMEACTTYQPWHNKKTHENYLRPCSGKCTHFYIYYIDEELGLCHLRIPTWAPFKLQVCMNGHNWLASEMTDVGIEFAQVDNAFTWVEDLDAAQKIADEFSPKRLHQRLDAMVKEFVPTLTTIDGGIQWNIAQIEYSTDIMFERPEVLSPVYEEVVRTLSHAVKPDQIAMFLGKRFSPLFEGEMGSGFVRRIAGMCLRHFMAASGIKIYDKYGRILRIECFTNKVGSFTHYRTVYHRDGTQSFTKAPVCKTIYSLPDLTRIMAACNRRYLEFIGAVDDPTNELRAVQRISRRIRKNDRTYRGFNLFEEDDLAAIRAISQGQHVGFGFRNKHLRGKLPGKSCAQIGRIIKRLRMHGLVKKAARSFKYHLTALGKRVAATALKLKEMFVIPSLRGHLATT
jgi:hypothetical protein